MLRAVYELADLEDQDVAIEVKESRGLVRFLLSSAHYTQAQADQLSVVAAQLLAGGQWFQLWRGEIVSMESPEDPRGRGTVARLHRGPLTQKAAQPHHRGA